MGEATQRLTVAGSHSRLGLEGHREEVAFSRGLPGRIRAQEAGCWQEAGVGPHLFWGCAAGTDLGTMEVTRPWQKAAGSHWRCWWVPASRLSCLLTSDGALQG